MGGESSMWPRPSQISPLAASKSSAVYGQLPWTIVIELFCGFASLDISSTSWLQEEFTH
jgi:hypothetical protein